MLAEFRARTAIHPGEIRLDWRWIGPDLWPKLRILRRCFAYPTGWADGIAVLDLAALLDTGGLPWPWIEQRLYFSQRNPARTTKAADDGPDAAPRSTGADGVIQAELVFYVQDAQKEGPAKIVITCNDPAADAPMLAVVEEVKRVEQEIIQSGESSTETLRIFVASDGGEILAGTVVVSRTSEPPGGRFQWSPAVSPAGSVGFERDAVQITVPTRFERDPDTVSAEFDTMLGPDEPRHPQRSSLRITQVESRFDADSSEWHTQGTLFDKGLTEETVHYYALFAADAEGSYGEPGWRTAATATRFYGMAERLYGMLPAALQRYDEPDPNRQGQGQLRRLLQMFGSALDQVRSDAEGLRTRHDVLNVRADFLPNLARWIGWDLDQTLGELAQRNDILAAPEVYATVGTAPNLRALVQRVTGWECRVKEFVHNVFLSNAPESIRLWEIWEHDFDGTRWVPSSAPLSCTEGFHGRPAAAVDREGVTWLFWHADGDSGRRILLQRFTGTQRVDPHPRQAMPGTGVYNDENPAAVARDGRIWLFWDSDREGSRNIYGRSYRLGPDQLPEPGEIEKLTDHPGQDRCPAAVCAGDGGTWLFWQSDRRGPTDIWACLHDGSAWGRPSRLTTAKLRDQTPAAALDKNGRVGLFWSADLGDCSALFGQFLDAGAWSDSERLTEGHGRDESPSALLHQGKLWLFWHCDEDGRWQIRGRCREDALWGAPFVVTISPASNKEPAAVADGTGLRLFYRSQLRGNTYRSRTVDFNDFQMLGAIRTFQDRVHYTYDTGTADDDWYARDTVGLYLRPDTEEEDLILYNRRLIEGPLQRFLPINVRPVFVIDLEIDERVYTYDYPDAKPQRIIGESYSDVLDSVATEPYIWREQPDWYEDSVPEWIWLYSWSQGADEHNCSVKFDAVPVDTRYRTRHVGIRPEYNPWNQSEPP